MENKIERVPYISKWYKWEEDCSGEHFRLDVERTNQYLKDELLHFDFKDEMMTGVNWLNKDTTTISFPNGINFWSPQKPQLKFEHHLTQKDVDYLIELLHLTHLDVKAIKNVPSREKDAIDRLLIITNYIRNSLGVRDKAQEKQLKELIEQSKPKKSYEGTLGEHWKELMILFDIISKYGMNSIKDIDENCLIAFQDDWNLTNKLHNVFKKLGIDFIKDFIKACEKCEE
jgi:hypothetical protein